MPATLEYSWMSWQISTSDVRVNHHRQKHICIYIYISIHKCTHNTYIDQTRRLSMHENNQDLPDVNRNSSHLICSVVLRPGVILQTHSTSRACRCRRLCLTHSSPLNLSRHLGMPWRCIGACQLTMPTLGGMPGSALNVCIQLYVHLVWLRHASGPKA